MNWPIILLVEDFQESIIKFWIGAFALFIFTATIHLLPIKVRRPLQTVLIILSAIIFVTNIFLFQKFSVPLNLDTLQILLGTNPLTAKAFLQEYILNFKILGSLAAFIALLTALSFGLKKLFATRSEERLKRLAIELIIFLFPPVMIYVCDAINVPFNATNNLFLNTMPWFTMSAIHELIKTAPIGSEEKIFAAMNQQLKTEKILTDASNIPWVVFVLGESTDRNHMQLYGYNLPTTPRLTARFEQGEIFRFNDTIACANNTAPAMARIFTFAEKDEPQNDWYFKANLFDILRRTDYHTVWLSNQSPLGLWGNFDKYFSARCDEKFFIEAEDKIAQQRQVDGVLLPVLDKFLAAPTAEKNFYLIHLYGTHGIYEERYPAKFEKFSSRDEDKPYESWREITAEYDNAVLYNDFIVDEIIRRFEDKNAVLIYISDHGEEVCEGRDFFGHSMEEEGNVHMIEIPALIWASKEFRERYPEKISAINAALDRPYRTDYLIHALLDLMDIRTTSFDASKSIINEKFKTRPRIYNGEPYSK
ncbi:MAG: phosphoethanolamine transferase [Selenomonadaceae bacterium]|nr:phosphoethanolamine transferase [Selenomonadaceae bacterium]